jgi:two-component system sensor histidine kinase YcbA
VVALVRSIFAAVVILVFKAYKRLLSREEHEERYRNLLTFISDLKAELYFMKSNMESIETVMGDAYTLFENLTEEDHKDSALSLQIAKDVHEIKKNYYRVVSGIEQISKSTLEYNYMSLHELFSILETSIVRELELKNRQIDVFFNSKDDVLIGQHYLLMSILRNLVTNGIEAMDEKSYGRIDVNHIMIEQDHLFTIVDNGMGIKEKDLPYVFDSGYSTKFNRVTGDIYRGLGLTLVKDIVEETFKGSISVASITGKGTRIELVIPRRTMEV